MSAVRLELAAHGWTPGPSEVQIIVSSIVSSIVVLVMLRLILGGCAQAIMLERKLSAWMPDRIGPNRTDARGMFQPLADGLKFLLQADYDPRGVDTGLFLLAPTNP